MSEPTSTTDRPQDTPGSFKMVAVMGAVGLISSVLLVLTYQITLPHIEQNRAELLERSIFEVLPGATTKTVFTKTEDGALVPVEDEEEAGFKLYAGYDDRGALVGIALEAQGQGFQDVLRLLYGYDPECACVIGMAVLESKETPGLGDKIETDPAFQANFDALDVQLAPDGESLEHDVTMVKKGNKTDPWQIEAITGATISSRAVTEIINENAAETLPLIQNNLSTLRGGQ